MITIKNKDPRAVLNSLHFWDLDISENDSFSNRRSTSIEREENLSLSECQKRSKILSKLDASFGPGEEKNISILTKCSINLDFNNEEEGFLNNWWTKIEELNELRLEYLASVDMDDWFSFDFLYLGSRVRLLEILENLFEFFDLTLNTWLASTGFYRVPLRDPGV